MLAVTMESLNNKSNYDNFYRTPYDYNDSMMGEFTENIQAQMG